MPIKRLASIRAASSKARKRRIRSGKRRVGEERRSRGAPYHLKKKKPEPSRLKASKGSVSPLTRTAPNGSTCKKPSRNITASRGSRNEHGLAIDAQPYAGWSVVQL